MQSKLLNLRLSLQLSKGAPGNRILKTAQRPLALESTATRLYDDEKSTFQDFRPPDVPSLRLVNKGNKINHSGSSVLTNIK